MKTKCFLFFLFIASVSFGQGQFNRDLKKNSVFFEGLGIARRYSFNYERVFQVSKNLYLAPAIGFQYSQALQSNVYNFFDLPFRLHCLIHKRQYYFDFGLDALYNRIWPSSPYANYNSDSNLFLLLEFGGRALFNKFFIKASVIPLLFSEYSRNKNFSFLLPFTDKLEQKNIDLWFWPSIGIGINF